MASLSASDPFLTWWLTDGEGSRHRAAFAIRTGRCDANKRKASKGKRDLHVDKLRLISVEDLLESKVPWLTTPSR